MNLQAIAAYTVGPTLIDLKIIYQTETSKISILFTFCAIGYTIGALSGFLFKFVNRQMMIGLFLISFGLLTSLFPHCKSIYLLYVCGMLQCITLGGIDAGHNVWIMEIWQEKSSTVLQGARFACGLGAILSPLIVKPFITGQLNQHNSTLQQTNTSYNDDGIDREAKLTIPYCINGSFCLIGGILVLILFCVKKYQTPENYKINCELRSKSNINERSSILIVIFGAILISFYGTTETTIFQYLSTYSYYSSLQFTADQGDSLVIALTLSYVIAKLMFILMSLKVTPQQILYQTFTLIIIAYAVFVYGVKSEQMIWLGTVLIGIGFSASYPSIFAYLEQYLEMTNKKGTVFVFSCGLLGIISPLIVGNYIENQSIILMYVCLINTSVSICSFIVIHFIVLLSQTKF